MTQAADKLVIVDGQSLNGGDGSPTEAWPYKLFTGVVPQTRVWIGGRAWAQLANTRYQRVDPKANAAREVLLSMMGATTDIAVGATGAATYAVMLAYAQAAKAAGEPGRVKVVNFTLIPSLEFDAGDEAQRLLMNTQLRGNAEGVYDGIVDLADTTAVPQLADPNNLTYFDPDGTHLTDAGYSVIVDVARPVIFPLLGIT